MEYEIYFFLNTIGVLVTISIVLYHFISKEFIELEEV